MSAAQAGAREAGVRPIRCGKGGEEVPGSGCGWLGGLGDTGHSGWRREVLPPRPKQGSAATSEHGPASVTPAGMVVRAGKAQGTVVQSKN